ncbi:MAG: acyl-CoA dehydrogenase family protein, partial [Myxococcota bacterium]|nr:acyl-CoA dehydrogenase family protein [Myxococcota bacterium]
MDFSLTPELQDLRAQVRAIVDDHVIAAEADVLAEDALGRDETMQRLRGLAREAGLWTPHLPPEHGGRGLGVMGMSVLFREMGRTPVGPSVFGCDAPDQGNMDLL